MCGIAGYFGFDSISDKQINSTLSLMHRRGPDDSACYRYSSDQLNLVLLHSRLSITGSDQSGSQPLVNSDYALIFNGEIYNYNELCLKHNLISSSDNISDSEVLFQLINQRIDVDSFYDKIDGMWAFAYFDFTKHQLVLSRDIFGEKPLFFLKTSTGIFFGSSPAYIQSLTQVSLSPDINKLDLCLQYDFRLFSSSSECFANGIQSVPSGIQLTFSDNLDVFEHRYFCPYNIEKIDLPSDSEDLERLVRDNLENSFSSRLATDQISTLFLSGGVDSSSIATLSHSKFTDLRYHLFRIVIRDIMRLTR